MARPLLRRSRTGCTDHRRGRGGAAHRPRHALGELRARSARRRPDVLVAPGEVRLSCSEGLGLLWLTPRLEPAQRSARRPHRQSAARLRPRSKDRTPGGRYRADFRAARRSRHDHLPGWRRSITWSSPRAPISRQTGLRPVARRDEGPQDRRAGHAGRQAAGSSDYFLGTEKPPGRCRSAPIRACPSSGRWRTAPESRRCRPLSGRSTRNVSCRSSRRSASASTCSAPTIPAAAGRRRSRRRSTGSEAASIPPSIPGSEANSSTPTTSAAFTRRPGHLPVRQSDRAGARREIAEGPHSASDLVVFKSATPCHCDGRGQETGHEISRFHAPSARRLRLRVGRPREPRLDRRATM